MKDNVNVLGSISGSGPSAPVLVKNLSKSQNPLQFTERAGIRFESSGADYAEYLPKRSLTEVISPGDIVGVSDGFVSLNTQGANQCMVVSMNPVVVGNSPGNNNSGFSLVSFLGQVYVRVVGPVRAGDYIIASGNNDGTGKAVNSKEINGNVLISVVGQAWESNTENEEKIVKVGITSTGQYQLGHSQLNDRLIETEREIVELRRRMELLEKKEKRSF